jgi:signal transduction histidine kinase
MTGLRWRRPSLRLRLMLAVTIPLVLVVGVYGLLRIRVEQAALLEEDRRNIALTARAIQSAIEIALRDRQMADARRVLAEMVEDQDQIDRIRVFDRELRPILVSNRLPIGDDVPIETLRRVMATGRTDSFYLHHGKQSVLYHVTPLRAHDGLIAGAMELVHLTVAVDQKVQAATRDVWVRLGVLLLVVTALTGFVLQRQVLAPLAQLVDAIRRLPGAARRPRLPVERRDELGEVALAFNETAELLEAARRQLLAEAERTLDLERQLRQAETLTVAGKLASSVAHEVGTPLNIVSGRAEQLLSALPSGDPRRADLRIIIQQIERISGILRSLLDTVRARKPDVQPTSLPAVLDRLMPLLRHAARRYDATVTASVPDDLPPILADPNQLQQLLINLVVNALEAASPSGRVEMTASPREHEGRPGVAMAVSDTGPGIPAEVLPRVFEAFFTTKPTGQGTGLGLAICREIVTQHGGDIGITSEVGVGTTVTVWLPRADESAPPALPAGSATG